MSKLETNTIDNISGSTTLTIGSTNTTTVSIPEDVTLGASGKTITIPSGATIANSGTATGFGGTNTPNFHAYISANTSIANATTITMPMNSERWDTASAFDTSTYTFTVPSGQGGKYNMTYKYTLASAFTSRMVGYFVVNGSNYAGLQMQHVSTDTGFIINANLNLSAGNTVTVTAYQDSGSSQTIIGTALWSEFSGYKIIE